MARAHDSAPPRQPSSIHFEATLAPVGSCFTLNADGEARLVLVVSAARALADAMAAGTLNDRTFLVAIDLGPQATAAS